MSHGHGHGHDAPRDADVRLLLTAAALLGAFMAAEIVVAVLESSVALLADAGHLLADVLALVMAATAARLAARAAGGRWTYGLERAEILSAAVNGVTLAIVAALVFAEALRRIVWPADVPGAALVVVALAGLVVNVGAVVLVGRADRRSLNVAGAFAHVLTDAVALAATLVAGIVLLVTGWRRADPIASLVVVVLMVKAAVHLLRDSGRVLLEGSPEHVDLDEIRRHLLETDRVVDVHDLHVWTAGARLPILTAHVVLDDECFRDGEAPALLDRLQHCIAGHFDVEHSTFQLEPAGHLAHEAGMH
jgi:cobalt-zinc-cadmium efflux system protein